MRAPSEAEHEVRATVEAFFDALANRRFEALIAAFAEDPDVALFGSEVSEVVVGRDALAQFLNRLCARRFGPRFTLGRHDVSMAGSIAWLTAPARVAIGEAVADPYRITLVLERRADRWLIVLFNGSEPAPDRA